MRSVVVVLPASIWAMIPMFLLRVRGTGLATRVSCPYFEKHRSLKLPAIVSKCLIGFCHLEGIFFFLDGTPTVVEGIQQLVGKFSLHRFSASAIGIQNQPADCETLTSGRPNLHGNLVG